LLIAFCLLAGRLVYRFFLVLRQDDGVQPIYLLVFYSPSDIAAYAAVWLFKLVIGNTSKRF